MIKKQKTGSEAVTYFFYINNELKHYLILTEQNRRERIEQVYKHNSTKSNLDSYSDPFLIQEYHQCTI